MLVGLAKQRPLILFVEDAENLDADSISVLDALVAQLDALQLCLPGLADPGKHITQYHQPTEVQARYKWPSAATITHCAWGLCFRGG